MLTQEQIDEIQAESREKGISALNVLLSTSFVLTVMARNRILYVLKNKSIITLYISFVTGDTLFHFNSPIFP